MPAAEYIERQVAVAVIVAVKEAAFLIAVQRVIGCVQIEHDLARRSLMRVEKQVHEQPLDRAVHRGRSCDSAASCPPPAHAPDG